MNESLSTRSAFVLWQHHNITLYYFQPNARGVNHNTIGRTIVFTCVLNNVFPTVYMCSFCSCVREHSMLCIKKAKHTNNLSSLCLFCWWLYMFRKRTQGFFLLCVSVWPPRGPWCQLRLSKQWICREWEKKNITRLSKMVLPFEYISP